MLLCEGGFNPTPGSKMTVVEKKVRLALAFEDEYQDINYQTTLLNSLDVSLKW